MYGLDTFREWFKGYEDNYTLIGGTACEILLNESNLTFRKTKDLDTVFTFESFSDIFYNRLLSFLEAGEFDSYVEKTTGNVRFFRFLNNKSNGFPTKIEFFSRGLDINFDNKKYTKLLLEDGEYAESLSAIVLDPNYYKLLKEGRVIISGVTVLSLFYLIIFKMKAYVNLLEESTKRHVNSDEINKHKNDVFRLNILVNASNMIFDSYLPIEVKNDIELFLDTIYSERDRIFLRDFNIFNETLEDIIDKYKSIFQL